MALHGAPDFVRPVPLSQRGGALRPRDELVADVERLEALLPAGVRCVSEIGLRLVARRYDDARRATERRRQLVAVRPEFHTAADHAVTGAAADARLADALVEGARSARQRLLAYGNGAGMAMILGCVVAVASGVDPLGSAVAVGMLASVGGPLGGLVGGWRGMVDARRVRDAARSVWADALARAGAETMGDLAAARVRFEAWRAACRELEMCVDSEQQAREMWQQIVGDDIDTAAVGSLAALLRQLRNANLGLLGHALADHAERHGSAEEASAAPPAVDLRSPSADLVIIDSPAPTLTDDGGSQVLELLERIKGRGLHLWVSS